MNSTIQNFFYTETGWGLHVTNTSNCLDNYEQQTTNLREIIENCHKKGINRILCESHKTTPMMSIIELFQTAENLVKWKAFGFRIAYLMPELVSNEGSIFFETAAHNRAIFIKFFADKDKAIEWLKG